MCGSNKSCWEVVPLVEPSRFNCFKFHQPTMQLQRFRFELRLAVRVCVLLYGLCGCGLTSAQDSNLRQELPARALWRIGEFGDTPSANGVYRLEYSDDGRFLAARNRENVVMVYEVANQRKFFEIAGHENNWIETIDFSPDTNYFVTAAGSTEKVKIWNALNGKLELEIDVDAKAAYFSADGQRILVLGRRHVVHYSWPGGKILDQQKWESNGELPVAMSRDGTLVVMYRSLGQEIHQTEILDLTNKTRTELHGDNSIPKFVVVSPDNHWVAAAYQQEFKIQIWNLPDPQNRHYVLEAHRDQVQSLAFSRDSRWLASSGSDQSAVVWDMVTRQSLGEFVGHTGHVNAVAFSPLDYALATGASGVRDTSVIAFELGSVLFPQTERKPLSFDEIWNGLAASTADTSLCATSQLIQRSAEFMPQLQQLVTTETLSASNDNVTKLVQQLNSPNFRSREIASEHLMTLREQAEPQMRQSLNQTLPVESRYRIQRILGDQPARPRVSIGDARRWNRVIFALEVIRSTESALLLQRIATGHSDQEIAAIARGAMDRNDQRVSQ